MRQLCLVLLSLPCLATGFSLTSLSTKRTSSLVMTSELRSLENQLFDLINTLDMKVTDFSEYQGVQKWDFDGSSGSIEWLDEVKGSKLTGLSRYETAGPKGDTFTLNAWVGPGLPVPHMLLTFGTNPAYEGFCVTADYLNRGPNPIGSDANYISSFYPDNVISSYDSIMALPRVVSLPPPISFSGRLLRSPLQVSCAGLTLDQLISLTTMHVSTWLASLGTAEPVQARSKGSFNSRDDKLRQYAYRANLADYRALLAESTDGMKVLGSLAAASTGPISEAYVGGGS